MATRKTVVESKRVPRIGPRSSPIVALPKGLLFSIDAIALKP